MSLELICPGCGGPLRTTKCREYSYRGGTATNTYEVCSCGFTSEVARLGALYYERFGLRHAIDRSLTYMKHARDCSVVNINGTCTCGLNKIAKLIGALVK